MIKAVALYRDGSKLSQPLAASYDLGGDAEKTIRQPPGSQPFAQPLQIAEKIVYRYIAKRRSHAATPQRLHAKGDDRRATKSICAPASTKAASSARSSSTCTRKARPSAR